MERQTDLSKSYSPNQLVWKRFRRNKLNLLSFYLILGALLLSVFAYLIIPDSSPDANQMNITLALKKPGFKVNMLELNRAYSSEDKPWIKRLFLGTEKHTKNIAVSEWHIKRDTLYYSSFGEEEIQNTAPEHLHLVSVLYPNYEKGTLESYEKKLSFIVDKQNITIERAQLIQAIQKRFFTKTFYLGTDRYGRDMLSRLILGTRVTLAVGFISVFISLFIGVVLGALAGYFKGWADNFIMWFINVIWSVPTLLLVIAITLVLGKGFWQIFVAIGLTMWVDVARVVRGQVKSVAEMEYVEAARALGFSTSRILFKHILPNIAGPIIVVAASNFASAILLEAGLSFLGVGAQPPTPSWGTMIKENYPYILMNLAYLALLPGLAIMFMVLAFNLVGKGLRDAFDTKEVSAGLN